MYLKWLKYKMILCNLVREIWLFVFDENKSRTERMKGKKYGKNNGDFPGVGGKWPPLSYVKNTNIRLTENMRHIMPTHCQRNEYEQENDVVCRPIKQSPGALTKPEISAPENARRTIRTGATVWIIHESRQSERKKNTHTH